MLVLVLSCILAVSPPPLPVFPKPLPPVLALMFARGRGVFDQPSPAFNAYIREPKNLYLVGRTMYLWVDADGVYHVTIQANTIPPGVTYTEL